MLLHSFVISSKQPPLPLLQLKDVGAKLVGSGFFIYGVISTAGISLILILLILGIAGYVLVQLTLLWNEHAWQTLDLDSCELRVTYPLSGIQFDAQGQLRVAYHPDYCDDGCEEYVIVKPDQIEVLQGDPAIRFERSDTRLMAPPLHLRALARTRQPVSFVISRYGPLIISCPEPEKLQKLLVGV